LWVSCVKVKEVERVRVGWGVKKIVQKERVLGNVQVCVCVGVAVTVYQMSSDRR
jgi:hypothetical protein